MFNALKDPIYDLRFLLNRGYNKDPAIKIVADKYRLTKKQRNFLLRAVFSKVEAIENKKKIIKNVKGRDLFVDGYNVLITVESHLKKKEIFVSDDGFVRDVSATFGKYKITKMTPGAIGMILEKIQKMGPEKVTFIFDSQVSKSGELCRIFKVKMKELGMKGTAKTAKNTDYVIANSKGIVCTSDRAIIKKVNLVLDLAGKVTGLGP